MNMEDKEIKEQIESIIGIKIDNNKEKTIEDEVKEIPQVPTSGLDMRAGMKDPLQALYEREAEKNCSGKIWCRCTDAV